MKQQNLTLVHPDNKGFVVQNKLIWKWLAYILASMLNDRSNASGISS